MPYRVKIEPGRNVVVTHAPINTQEAGILRSRIVRVIARTKIKCGYKFTAKMTDTTPGGKYEGHKRVFTFRNDFRDCTLTIEDAEDDSVPPFYDGNGAVSKVESEYHTGKEYAVWYMNPPQREQCVLKNEPIVMEFIAYDSFDAYGLDDENVIDERPDARTIECD